MKLSLLTLVTCLLSVTVSAGTSAVAGLKANAVRECLKGPAASVESLASVKEDGSFADVDYASLDRGSWPAGESVERIRALAVAAAQKPDEARFADAFRRSLGHFLDLDPRNPNWWWNEIGVPMHLGPALLVGEGILTPELRRKGLERLSRVRFGQTGQNRELIAWCILCRAMLEDDADLARQCRDEMAQAFAFGPRGGEGLMRDGIYHLHGHQPQMGGYGQQLVLDFLRYAPVFRGTDFDFTDSERTALLALVRDGYRWLLWRGCMEPGSVGRQIWPGAQRGRGDFIERALKEVGEACGTGPLDPAVTGFRFFDESAMAVYRTSKWMASVKMTLRGTPGAEQVNADNLKGGDFADGSMFTLVTGREYDDIYPLWGNWRLLPGLTSDPSVAVWNPRKWYGGQHSPNRETFCAGAGDASLAAVSFRFDDGVTSYLATRVFTPDFVFTVKGGVTGNATTCIEHAFDASPAGSEADVSPTRLLNGSVGYIVSQGSEVRRAEVSGDWHDIMGGMPAESVRKGRTFRVTYAHGGRDAVSWYVLPATTRDRLAAFDTEAIRIVENSATNQVLELPALHRRITVLVDSGIEIEPVADPSANRP